MFVVFPLQAIVGISVCCFPAAGYCWYKCLLFSCVIVGISVCCFPVIVGIRVCCFPAADYCWYKSLLFSYVIDGVRVVVFPLQATTRGATTRTARGSSRRCASCSRTTPPRWSCCTCWPTSTESWRMNLHHARTRSSQIKWNKCRVWCPCWLAMCTFGTRSKTLDEKQNLVVFSSKLFVQMHYIKKYIYLMMLLCIIKETMMYTRHRTKTKLGLFFKHI